MGFNIHLAIFAAFVAGVAAYLFIERRKFERHGIIFLRRTRRFLSIIDSIASWNPVLWKRLSIIFIAVGFAGMGYSVFWLVTQSLKMLETGRPVLSFLLPSPTGSFEFGNGYVLIPLWIWVIGISLIAIPHELFHGIMARVYGLRLKSVGIAFLGPIPGAFVEPDEREMERAGMMRKLAVLSAGSAINIAMGLSFLLTSFLLLKAFYHPAGVGYKYLINGSSAAEKNLSGFITAVNGIPVSTVEEMAEAMAGLGEGEIVRVSTTEGEYLLEARDIGGEVLIGISGVYTRMEPPESLPFLDVIMTLLTWLAMMEIGVGIANLLPMKPFDGGLMVEAVERRLGGSGRVSNVVSIAVFLLVASGFVIPRLLPLVRAII